MEKLTDKELNVLKYLKQGLAVNDIAERCEISRHTVTAIILHLHRKGAVNNT